MPQYDVFENPTAAQREGFPFLVVLQSDQFDQFTTRFVMPLARARVPAGVLPRRLSQTVDVRGEPHYPAAHLCGTLPSRILKKPVASLRSEARVLIDALDAVVSGV